MDACEPPRDAGNRMLVSHHVMLETHSESCVRVAWALACPAISLALMFLLVLSWETTLPCHLMKSGFQTQVVKPCLLQLFLPIEQSS